jgi:DNA-binding transcriptional LysR family regulator
MRMAIVGMPGCFAKRPPLQALQDLAAHDRICMGLPAHRELLLWELERNEQAVNVPVDGQWVFSNSPPMLQAALAGFGLVCLPRNGLGARRG